MKPRILFVDDEDMLLRGLRAGLRKQAARWDAVFACGGPAALNELARGPFDVVVSDRHMPRVDGIALLAHVGAHLPGAIRVLLSGSGDADARRQHVAHRYVAKPCPLDDMRALLARFEIAIGLVDASTRAVLGELDVTALPSFALLARSTPTPTPAEIAELGAAAVARCAPVAEPPHAVGAYLLVLYGDADAPASWSDRASAR